MSSISRNVKSKMPLSCRRIAALFAAASLKMQSSFIVASNPLPTVEIIVCSNKSFHQFWLISEGRGHEADSDSRGCAPHNLAFAPNPRVTCQCQNKPVRHIDPRFDDK